MDSNRCRPCIGCSQTDDKPIRKPTHPWKNNEAHPEPWTLVEERFMEKRQHLEMWKMNVENHIKNMEKRLVSSLLRHPHPVLSQDKEE